MKKKRKEHSDIYIRLDSSKAYDSKRSLLEMTEIVIRMQMISENLKKLAKGEVNKRNKSKKQIKTMISEINKLIDKMPKVKIERPKIKKEKTNEKIKIIPQKIKKSTLNQELEDVRKKIEDLKK